ncbi:MAG TPA: helix-turn-helix transcriptional regulator [Alphaproteobacteria bacterium]|nr:helix-turn-helix transcriptional regulator [Alphaproteobacteria bacterium]
MTVATQSIGNQLRNWRRRRRLSQLDLALEAEISTRHLSFVETGRAQPSRDMVLHLAEQLDVPLRERNRLLLAAGYAPMYGERGLEDPALAPARETVERLLAAHEPFPALALDRSWQVAATNAAVAPLLAGAAPALLVPPINVLRLSLHPEGLAPRIVNLPQWRAHLFDRLRRQVQMTADAGLAALLAELQSYPCSASAEHVVPGADQERSSIFVPLRLAVEDRVLSFISTTTVFGTPVDVTVSEITLETFFPADADTRRWLESRPRA